MQKRTLLLTGFVCVAGAVLVAAGVWAHATLSTSQNAFADNSTSLMDYHPSNAAAAMRGQYVMRAADCDACHTASSGELAGGYHITTPFGTLVSSNITPDATTGIGKMTERQFFNSVRNGQGLHGLLYPAMPYTAYVKLSNDDMKDLWVYMTTVKPVTNPVNENADLGFPFNQRYVMLGWNMLFFDNSPFKSKYPENSSLARGEYLVDAAGHCSACHTPRNFLSAEESGKFLQGARIGSWYAPEITGNSYLGVGRKSVQQLADYLRKGTDGSSNAAGPMGEAVQHSLQYLSPEDAKAIAGYLKSLPGSGAVAPPPMGAESGEMHKGKLSYEVNCSACHGVNGEGMGNLVPALGGNPELVSSDITNLAHVLLLGSRAVATPAAITGGGMPSFAWKLSDQDMAEVLDYIRNSWGNAALPVRSSDIAALRHELGASSQMGGGSTVGSKQ